MTLLLFNIQYVWSVVRGVIVYVTSTFTCNIDVDVMYSMYKLTIYVTMTDYFFMIMFYLDIIMNKYLKNYENRVFTTDR